MNLRRELNFALLAVVYLTYLEWGVQGFGMTKSKGIVKLLNLLDCDTNYTAFSFVYSLKNIRDEDKALDFTLDTEQDLTDDLTHLTSVDIWSMGQWLENVHSNQGVLCEDILKFLPKLWPKLAKAMEPNAPETACPLKAGTYTVTDFEANPEDVEFRGVMPGEMRLTIHVFDGKQNIVFCKHAMLRVY